MTPAIIRIVFVLRLLLVALVTLARVIVGIRTLTA